MQIDILVSLPLPPGNEAEIWESGGFIDTGIAGGISGVNDLGWAVGVQRDFTYAAIGAFLWRNGSVTLLPQLSYAEAINESGQIAGLVKTAGGQTEAALYQDGLVTPLGFLNATLPYSYAAALNNAGEVVGNSTVASGIAHAVSWKDGVMTDLGVLSQGDGSTAYAINDQGQVVGAETSPDNTHSTAILWQNGGMTALAQPATDDYSRAEGINDAGLIVGTGHVKGGVSSDSEAILWAQGQAIALTSLLPADSGWSLATADRIDDQGHIFGAGSFDGEASSYELTLGDGETVQIGVAAQTAASLAVDIEEGANPIHSPFQVIDNATDVAASLDLLQRLAKANDLTGISLTDGGTPNITVTAAQFTADQAALNDITGAHSVTVQMTGTAALHNFSGENWAGADALHFSDQTVIAAAMPGSANAATTGNVAELYSAALAREPDVGGLAFYRNYLKANPNTPLLTLAEFFLNSSEYGASHNYAQTTAGDTRFIEDSYQTLLHRTPTSDEVDFYLNTVMGKPDAHAQMLVYLSASSEFLSTVQITTAHPASAQHWLILI